MHFLRVLPWSEVLTASPRIWSQVTDSISYDNNRGSNTKYSEARYQRNFQELLELSLKSFYITQGELRDVAVITSKTMWYRIRGHRSVTIISVRSEHGDLSSNPGRSGLHFYTTQISWGKVYIELVSLQLRVNSRAN